MKTALRVLLVLLVLAAGGFVYRTEYRTEVLCTVPSPDGAYELTVLSVGDPGFTNGDASCRLVLRARRRQICRCDVSVANDGGPARVEDFSAAWYGDRVCVTVHSDEREDQLLSLCFDGRTEAPSAR